MLTSPLTLGDDGYLSRDGKRFVPMGINYWPGSCGTEMWTKWPEAEMRRDLERIAELGLNCIRFFLLWQDFEPEEGKWNDLALERLDSFLGWCNEAGLYAQPTLFVGWMSGGIFWPKWKAGRNLFSDRDMRQVSVRFAGKVAGACRPHHVGLMGFDLGNELDCLPENFEAKPADIWAWSKVVADAIREHCPGSWVMVGNDQGQVNWDSGWRLDRQEGLDCLSMHTYPVPGWHPVPCDGLTDPLTRTFLPFYVKAARAFGPVMAQEFGTILTRAPGVQQQYLRPMLEECWQAGAIGFLYWCWSDFACTHHPYNKNSFEKDLGLIDLDGTVKPGPGQFLEFAKALPSLPAPRTRKREVVLYWPEHYYARECPENPGNTPGQSSARMILAHYLMERTGLSTGVARLGDLPGLDGEILVMAGVFLTALEIDRVREWVEAGGCVLWHGPDPFNMGPEFRKCAGFAAIDFHQFAVPACTAHGEDWELKRFPRDLRVSLELCGGEVLYRAGDVPVGVFHQVGKGRVLTILADVEGNILDDARQREKRDRWSLWYRGMIDRLRTASGRD